MAWIYLIIAGLFECGWAIGLKYTDGFTRLTPSLLTVAAMAISFWLLSVAMKSIPIGTAYAVWTGIGAIGVAIISLARLMNFLINQPAVDCQRNHRTQAVVQVGAASAANRFQTNNLQPDAYCCKSLVFIINRIRG